MSSSSPSNTTTTAENKAAAATPDNLKRRPCLPPGLELLLLTTTSRVPPVSFGDGGGGGLGQLTPFTATVLVVHWSIVRNISENKHFRLIPNEDDVTTTTTTEVLPADWRTRIGDLEGCACLTLQYRELSNSYEYSVKLIELVKDKTVVVVCNIKKSDDIEEERLARQQRAKDRGLSTTTLVQVDEFIDTDKFVMKGKEDIVGVFKVQGVWELQSKVQNVLLNCSLDEGCEEPIRSTPIKPPYASNLTAEQKERLDRERKERRRREDEEIMRQIAEEHRGFVPPPGMVGGIPVMPFQRPRLDPLLGDFGRSDLDPFRGDGFGVGGGIGGVGGGALGGMLMDPRGFRGGARGPHLPPGVVPPGARFDPIGPFGGGGFGGGGFGGGGRGGRGGGAAGGIPFGLPNPDHERVPDGLDDMFT